MGFHWLTFVHLGILSVALVLATWIRSRLPFFQRYLIPNSLTAGFLLLLFYNLAARPLGLDTAPLGDLIYHLLSISFIAMSLRALPPKKTGRRVFATGLAIAASFPLQAPLGLGLAFLLRRGGADQPGDPQGLGRSAAPGPRCPPGPAVRGLPGRQQAAGGLAPDHGHRGGGHHGRQPRGGAGLLPGHLPSIEGADRAAFPGGA